MHLCYKTAIAAVTISKTPLFIQSSDILWSLFVFCLFCFVVFFGLLLFLVNVLFCFVLEDS